MVVLPVPALLAKVPALLNSAVVPSSAPPKFWVNMSPSKPVSNSEPARFTIVPEPGSPPPFRLMLPAVQLAPP